ncbi:MAG: leucine--tRNA ligase [Candidatus Vogelbacteria bacterium GWA1_51_14]|uniref:Leucine--tRNA ligase n=1 Tax=Candidatus Vogelbacteria bacterium GWA1_51_14 TaxID=1802435 RepID=A0A1G2Q9Q4_9BACT|nr:MAG: leucine--tRNA ligase [Candidatus Vogelbacteria bacterium GWA1_51_14]
MEKYDHKKVEAKQQQKWWDADIDKVGGDPTKPKCYILDMFPYPSGEGLHVGHPKGYIATDIYSRMKKMQGYNILHPMGWDAFGLPAENYALKNKIHPKVAVEKNIATFKSQLKKIGFNYDWEREINTTDPEYYKWTQWIFLKLFEKGLAYESHEPINWCPSCQTGLANEDLEAGRCERCGSEVEKKPMRQWVLKITDYADRLLVDLDLPELKWPEYIKESQRNWIGRSEGAEISFQLSDANDTNKHTNETNRAPTAITIFTTRPDTIYGATFMAISPELADEWLKVGWEPDTKIKKYIADTLATRAQQTYKDNPEKTGIFSGIYAINPANGEEIPVWITNYVLGDIGTGAIMAVPAHDERDFEFAQKFNLPISDANLVDSNEVIEKVGGKKTVRYKLKDWVFSRQRYWGEPIPIIHCETCGVVPVPESDLPVELPEVAHYEPSGTGESPLANITDWVNTTCPKCGGPGKRETNTMPQWAGSSWYYLAYTCKDPKTISYKLKAPPAVGHGKSYLDYWNPVDVYVGGAEHATRHLIYARFWHKFLQDIGVAGNPEPFIELHNVGLILAEDGKKMSKRYGNVINPDEIVELYGADSLRLYEMFMGPFADEITWQTDSVIGVRRFLEKVWHLAGKITDLEVEPPSDKSLHQTIKKVTEDILNFRFNTAISTMMIQVNTWDKLGVVNLDDFKTFLKLLAPFAPHLADELWEQTGERESIHLAKWPEYDITKVGSDIITLAVQVDGKTRGTIQISPNAEEEAATNKAQAEPEIAKWLAGQAPKRVIYVAGRVINFLT